MVKVPVEFAFVTVGRIVRLDGREMIFVRLRSMVETAMKAGLCTAVLKTEPTPDEVNFSIVLELTLATYRLPALSKAIPCGPFRPVLAKTVPTPAVLNFSMVLLPELAT